MATFVLVHSPIVSPFTWALTAHELEQDFDVLLPELGNEDKTPYWQRHSADVARALDQAGTSEPLILAAHSGGGALLPAIRQTLGRPIGAYLFVDAVIPRDGFSRLDLLAWESPELAGEIRRGLESGQRLPVWTEEDLREVVPDAELRKSILAGLRPQPLAFYDEPIPVFSGWPDAPCGYVQFSPVYDAYGEQAREAGWAYRQLDGGHFHMLVDPAGVAHALVDMAGALGVHTKRSG